MTCEHLNSRSHCLERTSPKDEPFIGRCTNCGMGNLTLNESLDLCPNPLNKPIIDETEHKPS
jgi:hypothetical protein